MPTKVALVKMDKKKKSVVFIAVVKFSTVNVKKKTSLNTIIGGDILSFVEFLLLE